MALPAKEAMTMELRVYVPVSGHPASAGILPGSGIVGTPQAGGRILADYEGNRFGGDSLVVYADRVHHAAGRHTSRYPTVARSLVPADSLREVGWWDQDTGLVAPHGPDEAALLAGWLGTEHLDDRELQATSGGHAIRRELRAALASPDPAMRMFARQQARRHGLDAQGDRL